MIEYPTKGLRHTDGSKLLRWLGTQQTEQLSAAMRNYYYPIAVAGVPGNVWAMPGGDFVGECRAGYEATARDRLRDATRRLVRGYRSSCRPNGTMHSGFASLSALINAVTTNAARQELAYFKIGTAGVAGGANSLWRVGSHPVAASAAAAAPGGEAPTSATAGAIIFNNPTGGTTSHITTGQPSASVVNNTLLLYDRIYQVAKTMNSTATEAVTGVPTRYQGTTPNAANFSGGNFLFPECGTVLAAVGHNWTVCKYTNQDGGSPDALLPSAVGNSSNAVNRLDLPLGTWFFPLASGDYGVKSLNQMQCSALVTTGAIDFVIGHQLAIMPCPFAYAACTYDGINTAFGLVRVFDSACLALLEVNKPTTGAASYAGTVSLASA